MEIEVEGYKLEKEGKLIWWNGLEVVQSIFGNMIFAQNMSFDPIKVWEGSKSEYREWLWQIRHSAFRYIYFF